MKGTHSDWRQTGGFLYYISYALITLRKKHFLCVTIELIIKTCGSLGELETYTHVSITVCENTENVFYFFIR